jgi:hypothetical protein
MPEDGLQDVFRVAASAQQAHAFRRMLPGGRALRVGIALVVEVVHQAGQPPALLVLAVLPGVRAHRGLHRQHVLA